MRRRADAISHLFDGRVTGRLHRWTRRRNRLGAPNEELHRFHNQQTRAIGAHVCSRGLYEAMLPWEARMPAR